MAEISNKSGRALTFGSFIAPAKIEPMSKSNQLGKVAKRTAALVGQRFGHLTVTGEAGRSGRHVVVSADCDCGKATRVRLDALKRGNTVSCGCVGRQRYIDHQSTRAGRLGEATAQRAFSARCEGQSDSQIGSTLHIDSALVGFLFRRRRKSLLRHLAFIGQNLNQPFAWLAKVLQITEVEAAWLVKQVRRSLGAAKAAAHSAAKAGAIIADHAFARIRRVREMVGAATVLPGKLLSFAARLRKRPTQLGTVLGIDLVPHATTIERKSLLDWFRSAIDDTTAHRRAQRFRFFHAA